MTNEKNDAVPISMIVLSVLVAVAAFLPDAAVAGKKHKKRIREEVKVAAYPYPVTGGLNGGGCLHGIEGINKLTIPFKPPWRGMLVAELFDFQIDWDLHLTTPDGKVIESSNYSQPESPQVEELSLALAKDQEVLIVACNWLGGTEATLRYTYTYR